MKILFVCLAGQSRSPTGAEVLREICDGGVESLEVNHVALLEMRERSRESIMQELRSYDGIFVMDAQMRTVLTKKYNVPEGKVHNLNVPDIFDKNVPQELERLRQTMMGKLTDYVYRYIAENANQDK